MQVSECRLVTVSREFGAGGSDLARMLGAELGWPVLDQDLVHRVAEQLRFDDATIARFDEHPPTLVQRIATVLIIPQPDLYSFPPTGDLPSHDAIAAASTRVIKDAAHNPPLIVVGHGAQCIFGGRPDAMHVRVIAPPANRVRRIMARMHVDSAAANTMLRRADHDRQAYMQRHFHQDWYSPLLYDLQVNTGRMPIEDASSTVAALVRRRAGQGTASEA
jgi:cytidylate kinase